MILGRPNNERPLLILVTGYPADEVVVPEIGRKSLDEIATFVRWPVPQPSCPGSAFPSGVSRALALAIPERSAL